MGNVESRPVNRPVIEVSHKTARPLPPLPDDEIDEYDLDSPPPYPPPPPPHEENGGKSKRVSWKFREPNFFGGLKRGSWVLQPHNETAATYKYHDTKKGTPTLTGKNISNTIATEDNNVVTVSVIGTPDKDDIIKPYGNDSTTVDDSQNSWAVKNMQLILNSEMQTGDISSSRKNISDSIKVDPSLESTHYPYPDVQTYSENEVSSLPDVVTVKSRKLDISNEANISITKETVHLKRVEDIRLDYPEGNAREVSNYNTLEYNKEDTSIQPLNLQVEGDGRLDVSVGRSSGDVKNDSKSKKGKLPSCFGKRKADISDEEFDETAFSIEKERSGASSPESKTLSLTPSDLNLNVSPVSSTPKKSKKTKIGSCFSKNPSKDEIDGPLSTSTPDIDSRLNLGGSGSIGGSNLKGSGSIGGSSERVEYITPKLEAECEIDTNLKKDVKSPKKTKSNLGSCFGKNKSEKSEKSSEKEGEFKDKSEKSEKSSEKEGEFKGKLNLKADNKSSISFEKSVPEGDLNAGIKTQKNKKSPLTACFGKDSKNKYEVTNASQEFEIKTKHDVVGRIDTLPSELEIQKENLSKNINIDYEMEITSPSADFDIKSPNANISFEEPSLKTDFDTKPEIDMEKFNITSDLTAKFPEKYSQSTDFDSPSKNINLNLHTPEVDIKQPTVEIETPKLKLSDHDTEDKNLALNLNTNVKDGGSEWMSKDMNISYFPTLEFKDNNFNSNQKLEIIPPSVDLRIEPETTEEIKYKPIDTDKQMEIGLTPQPLDIKGSVDVPSANIELQRNEELKLEIPGLIVKEKRESYDLPELSLEIDPLKKDDINSEKINVDLATPNVEPHLTIQPKKIGKTKKPKAKFGSCFGKSKADVDVSVQSPEIKEGKVRSPSLDVSLPSLEVDAGADDAKLKGDIELSGPKIETTPKGSGKGKFKLGSCLGKDKSKSAKVDKPDIEVEIPKDGVSVSAEVETPKIEGDVKIEKDIDVKGPKVEGKGKLGLGSCFGKSKTPKVKTEIDIPDSDISGASVSGEPLEADVRVKSPEVDIKGDVGSPTINSDIDVETPEVKIDGKKKKGSLGSCFGKPKSKDIEKQKSSLEVEGEIKGVPSIEGEMKVEGKLPLGEIASKKKKANLGSCFGKKDKPKLKAGVEIEPPKHKLKQEIDIKPPKAEFSADTPSINIEANAPDVTFDPSIKVGTVDLDINKDKPEVSVELSSVNVEGKIPEASLDVDVPSISLKSPDVDLDIPKYEIGIEGKSSDISVSPNVDLDIKSPDLDLKGNVDFKIDPKLPSAELDLDVSGKDIKVPKIEGKVEGELPKLDTKFDIDTNFPKVDMEVETPELSLQKEGSIRIPTPDIEVDISSNVPDVELGGDIKVEAPTVDVKGPNIKGKKVKSKMPSCFGKDDKAKKGEAYMPSCEGEVRVKTPDVEGKVDAEPPSFEGDVSLRAPDLKVEPKKSKGKLGSCFGKPKAPKVEGKLSSSVEGELPTLKGEVDVPKAEVDIKATKPTKKASSGFGSCFGKKAKVDASIEAPSVDVATPSGELSVDVNTPKVKSDIKIEEPDLNVKAEVKKPKSKFSSCFGKPKADVDMSVHAPESKGDIKVKTPSLDIGSPSVEVEGSVDVPSVQIDDTELKGDVELRGPKVEAKSPKGSGKGKFKLGSCFGKDKDKSVKVDKPEVEVVAPEGGIKGSVEIETPKIEGDVKTGIASVDIKGPKGDGKGKLGLGSCFGKSKAPKLKAEVNVPESNISGPSSSGANFDADVKIKSPELDIKGDIDSLIIKGDIDIDTPEIQTDSKKKKKSSFGSCFGKQKSIDVNKKKPSLEVEGGIKGVPSIEGEMKVEGKLSSAEIPSKKKNLNFGSCFGKKDKHKLKADIDIKPPEAELSAEIPSVKIEGSAPDITFDPNVKVDTLDLDINKDKPEVSVELPSVNVEGKIPEASLDVDVPSISLKSPDVDLDIPKYKMGIEGKCPDISVSPNVDLDIKSPDLDLKSDVDFKIEAPKLPSAELDLDVSGEDLDIKSADLDFKGDVDFKIEGPKLPSAELDLDVSGEAVKVPKVEGKFEGELPKLDPKFDINTNLPKVDMKVATAELSLQKEGSIKVPTPDIEVDISGNVPDVEVGGDIKVEAPTVDVKGPKIKGKKVKSKMPSCFGKGDKAKKGDAYMPSCEGQVSVKTPDVEGKVDLESPSFEGDASLRAPDLKVEPKKSKGKLGSCFGKPKSPAAPKLEGKLSSSVEGELPTLKGEVDVPKAEVDIKATKPTKKASSGFGSCFGKKAKVDASIEAPSLDVAAPSGELSVDVDTPQMKSDIKIEESDLNAKTEVKKPKNKFGSCFGKPKADVDMSVHAPESKGVIKVKTPSLDIGSPSVEVEGSVDVPSVPIDDPEIKGDVELRGAEVEAKSPKGSGKGKFKLGSCFGKEKGTSIKVDKPEVEVVAPEGGFKGSVEIETPKIEGDVRTGKASVDVKSPKADDKGKLGLGSCFGKSKAPKLKAEVNVPESDISGPSLSGANVDADVKIKSPELDIKGDIDSPVIKGDIDIDTPEIQIDGKKKKKSSLGSCFGKQKSIDDNKKKPSLEVEGGIEGGPSIEGEMKVEGKLSSGEIPDKKKNLNFGSCFGKKDKPKLKSDIDIKPPEAELSAKIPSVKTEGSAPDLTFDPSVKVGTFDLDINKDKPEVSVELPPVNVEGKIPEASLDLDVPSISLKSPDVDLDIPKYEMGIEGKIPEISVSPNGNLNMKSPDLDLKGDVDFSAEGPKLPSADLDLGVSGTEISVPNIECKIEEVPKFDPKFDIDIDASFPKVDMEWTAPEISLEKKDNSKVKTPCIEVDISSSIPDVEIGGDVKVEAPSVDVKGPKMKGKKIKSKIPSCFGKSDKDRNFYAPTTPTTEGDVNVNGVDSSNADVSLPTVECNGSPIDSGARNKKKRINFGSCLGKKSDADLNAENKFGTPEVSVSGDISKSRDPNEKISHVSGDLDFSVNGFDKFPEKNILLKGFPQESVTSNVEEDVKIESNGLYSDFSVELPQASVDGSTPIGLSFKNSEDKCDRIDDSLRFPDVVAVSRRGITFDLSTSATKEIPSEDMKLENDFSDDIFAKCSFNIPISESNNGYRADIPISYSKDQSQLYENVSRPSTGKDHLPDINVVGFHITSKAQNPETENDYVNSSEKTNNILIKPSQKETALSPDLKVHFLDDNDSSEHSHPVYCNVDSRVEVDVPTYENVTFPSPHSLSQHEHSDVEFSEIPKPPKRWYGIDGAAAEGTVNVPDVDIKTDFVLKDKESDTPQNIPLEAMSDFQSIQFVKQMVEDDERKKDGVSEGRLGKISFASSKPEVAGQFHTNVNTSDLLAKKLEEFDNNTYDSQPVVKRTIKVKTFKIKEGSDEPEEVIEEFEAEGEELEHDAAKLLSKKIAELKSGLSDSQPEIKRTVRIKTFKTKEGSDEPEELIEEFVNESNIPLDSSVMFKTTYEDKDKRGAKFFEIQDGELKQHAGSFDTSDLLIKKLTDFDMDSSRPVVKRTVRVKTYSTKDGDDNSEEIVEEFEGNEDSSLGKSEATNYLLKKIADFDGKGISGEPFVKRTVKVKTYKTKEGSDDTETIEEFEHSSSDLSLSDILHDRYPELRETKFESHNILKSLDNPNSQETLSKQSSLQIGKSGELEGNIKFSHSDTK